MARYFAAVGDVHGEMKKMVRLVQRTVAEAGLELDEAAAAAAAAGATAGAAAAAAAASPLEFVLQVGDFEPNRDAADLASMASPEKHRHLGDYHEFDRGQETFPWPLYFIGGNHEPYGYLDQHLDGAQLIPNCTYLGRVGSAELGGGLRVAGISGIFSPSRFDKPRPSYRVIASNSVKQYTYYNQDDIAKARALVDAAAAAPPIDVFLCHDWPSGLPKPAATGRAIEGSTHLRNLIERLRPRLVLCGHEHQEHSAEIDLPPSAVRKQGSRTVSVECLGAVWQAGAVKIFRVDPDGSITLVHKNTFVEP
jgi:lariat debranching enzyme